MEIVFRRPRVYRYLESNFVDDFFRSGNLKLSSFAEFRSHKDERRLDSSEGKTYLVHRTAQNGGQTFITEAEFGNDAYVMCGSLLPSRRLMENFRSNSAMVITEPVGFAQAVARALPDYRSCLVGPCSYQSRRLLEYDLGWIDFGVEKETSDIAAFNQRALTETLNSMAHESVYFLKHDHYAGETEWRFVWLMDRPVDGSLIISVPEARAFCARWGDLAEAICFL